VPVDSLPDGYLKNIQKQLEDQIREIQEALMQ